MPSFLGEQAKVMDNSQTKFRLDVASPLPRYLVPRMPNPSRCSGAWDAKEQCMGKGNTSIQIQRKI